MKYLKSFATFALVSTLLLNSSCTEDNPVDPSDTWVGSWNASRNCQQSTCGSGNPYPPSSQSGLIIITKSSSSTVTLTSPLFISQLTGTVSGNAIVILGTVYSSNTASQQFSGTLSGNTLSLSYSAILPGTCNGGSTTFSCTYNCTK